MEDLGQTGHNSPRPDGTTWLAMCYSLISVGWLFGMLTVFRGPPNSVLGAFLRLGFCDFGALAIAVAGLWTACHSRDAAAKVGAIIWAAMPITLALLFAVCDILRLFGIRPTY